jgi:DNA repair exonuclease SbcCD nuclease subunit
MVIMSFNEVKILHCADLHLGVEFATLGDKAGQRKRENFLAFERIISVCKEEKVDFLLIAGDLFDHLHIDSQLVTEVMGLITKIPETVVAIAPGNHDPFSIDSCYYTRTWPENVRLFPNELSYYTFEEKNICLWGAGFESTYHPEPFLAVDPEALDDNRINICLVHGDLIPQGQGSLYNPLSKELIRQSRFDYIALGHVHKRTAVAREGKTWYAYPGPPEGHGFDEPGEQGVYLGSISKGAHSLKFRRICNRCYYEIPVLISDIRINQEIASRVIQTLKERFAEEAKDHLYKILLKGEVPGGMTIDPDYIAQKIASECFFSKIENHTTIALDYDILSKEQTLKGIFVRKMREEIAAAASKNNDAAVLLAQSALQTGLKAFEGEVIFDED